MHTRTHPKKTPVLWKTGGKEWVPLKRVSTEMQPESDFSAARRGRRRLCSAGFPLAFEKKTQYLEG